MIETNYTVEELIKTAPAPLQTAFVWISIIVGVAWAISWLLFPWFVLIRLRKIHDSVKEIKAQHVNGKSENPFEL